MKLLDLIFCGYEMKEFIINLCDLCGNACDTIRIYKLSDLPMQYKDCKVIMYKTIKRGVIEITVITNK